LASRAQPKVQKTSLKGNAKFNHEEQKPSQIPLSAVLNIAFLTDFPFLTVFMAKISQKRNILHPRVGKRENPCPSVKNELVKEKTLSQQGESVSKNIYCTNKCKKCRNCEEIKTQACKSVKSDLKLEGASGVEG
jgi:hypothetical protein